MFFLVLWGISVVAAAYVAHKKNLSVAGFIVVALFTGPLAVLIVYLLAPLSGTRVSGGSAQEELGSIKRSFTQLEQRISALEKRIGMSVPESVPGQSQVQSAAKPVIVSPGKSEAAGRESLEFLLGKYWLNRIGVVAVFLGVAFFISYTFSYLNAIAKISIGYLISIVFFVWGGYLEKKEKYVRLSWGVLGGAWGLLYLSTYAMYYIRQTQIITSPGVELFLLALLSFFAVAKNLRYRSWVVTSLTFLFAFLTAGLGGMEYSTIFYCTFLTIGIVFLADKLRWNKFFLFGIVGLYLTYAYWLWPNIFTAELVSVSFTVPVVQFILIFSILSITYASFTLGIFNIKEENNGSLRYTVSGLLLNTGFYVILALSALYRLNRSQDFSWDIRSWFLLIVSFLCLCYAGVYKLRGLSRAIVSCVSSSLVLASMAMVIHYGAYNAAFFWLCATAAFFVLGVYYKEFIYRAIAAAASLFVFVRLIGFDYFSSRPHLIFGIEFSHVVLTFGCWAAYCLVAGALERSSRIQPFLRKEEKLIHSCLICMGAVLLTVLLFKEAPARWLTLALAVLAAFLLSAGFLLERKVFRFCGLGIILISCGRLVFVDMVNVHTLYRIITFTLLGVALLAASMAYSKFMMKPRQS